MTDIRGIGTQGFDRLAAARALLAARQGAARVGGAATGVPRGEDSVSISDSAKTLGDLRGLISTIRSTFAKASSAGVAGVREQLASIAAGARAVPQDVHYRQGFGVESSELLYADLEPGERVDIDGTVTQSAQRASVFIRQFGAYTPGTPPADAEVSFFAGSAVTLQIAGNLGTANVTFASGQTLGSVAQAIDQLAGQTGVHATVRDDVLPPTLQFTSQGYGSDEFVSINRVDEPDNDAQLVWEFLAADPEDANRPLTQRLADFNAGEIARDTGQNIGVEVNGQAVETYGLDISVLTDRFGARFTINPDGRFAQPGTYRLGSIFRQDDGSHPYAQPPGGRG